MKPTYEINAFKASENMLSHGGSFVKVLANLYRLADPINKERVLKAFQDEFKTYEDFAS
jgi:hypothetical protein